MNNKKKDLWVLYLSIFSPVLFLLSQTTMHACKTPWAFTLKSALSCLLTKINTWKNIYIYSLNKTLNKSFVSSRNLWLLWEWLNKLYIWDSKFYREILKKRLHRKQEMCSQKKIKCSLGKQEKRRFNVPSNWPCSVKWIYPRVMFARH